jgi:hypothetical protein
MKHIVTLLIISLLSSFFFSNNPAQAQETCSQAPRLIVTQYGRVVTAPDLPNRLRSQPGFDGVVIGNIPAGAIFYVSNGPACVDGLYWWQINYQGISAWTAEGSGAWEYWLEPYAYRDPGLTCTLAPRLSAGQYARVLPGLPNVLRNLAGTVYPSQIIGEIPAGGIFYLVEGPRCSSDGRYWWRVNYNGTLGWTAEGQGYSYWVEPYNNTGSQCPNALPSRLIVGGQAQVTSYPSYPNTVRANPSRYASRLGSIPVGGVMTVLSGPYCADNTAWWQVQYGSLVGYTAESGGGNYWLQSR